MKVNTRNDCFEQIRKALPEAKAAQIEEILDEIDGMRSKIFGDSPELGSAEFLKQAQDFIENRRIQRARDQIRRIKDIEKREARHAFYTQDAYRGDAASAMESMLVRGEARLSKGGNYSVEGEKNSLAASWMNMIREGLDGPKLWDYAASALEDREIAKALSDPKADVRPEAKTVGSVIRAVYNSMLQAKRDAGADVGEIMGYIMRQSHDQERILAAGFKDWSAFILPKLDHEKTFGALEDPAKKLEMLHEIYDEITNGYYGSSVTPGNLEKKVTRSRSIHFNGSDSFMDYNEKFGRENLLQSVFSTIRSSARDVAFLRAFGSNPREAFESDLRELSNQFGKEFIGDATTRLKNRFDQVAEIKRGPPETFAGRAAQNATIWENLHHMGAAAFAQVNDLATMIAMTSASTGKSYLGSAADVAKELMAVLPKGSQKKWLIRAGKMFEDILAEDYARFGAADPAAPGTMAKAQRLLFRFNGMEAINQKSQGAMSALFAKALGDNADKSFGSLTKRWQATLLRYGIDADLWEKIRFGTEDVDGEKVISHFGVEQLPDSVFGSPQAKRDAALRVQVALNDFINTAVPHPGDRIRSQLLQNTSPDDALGIVLRLGTQYKSFALAATSVVKRIGLSNPERLSRGWKDIFTLKGDNSALAQFLLTSTFMAYVSTSLYDLASGKKLKDPTDYRNVLNAMVRGGAAGLYGDYILGEFNRDAGRGVWEAVVGPGFSDMGKLAELNSAAIYGDGKKRQKAAFDAVTWASRQVPFSNLFYTKHAFDSLVTANLQDMMNPGYTRRRERRVQQDQGYFLSPTQLQEAVGGIGQ